MRIERLAENKVKVTLTGDDLNGFDINVKKLSDNSAELHSFLFKIMETIHEETGFNPYSGQIVIEAQSVGDGISIIISKIEPSGGRTTEGVKDGRRVRARIRERKTGIDTYYFESFEDVCEMLVNIENSVHSHSALYKINGEYCYLLDFENPYFKTGNALYETISILAEFSARSSVFPMQHLHVKEHGKAVAVNEALVSMADGLRSINKV